MKSGIRCAALGALAVLAACAHAPGPADIPPAASFDAQILDNGTKLFVYRQRGLGGPQREDDDPRRSGPPQRRLSSEQMQKIAQRGIAAMLAQNGYCRDGYMVLEQYEQQRSYVVRGECRDAANATDREKYSARR